ncbi:MAG: hypothetical protein J6F30_08850 [Cellulosilyticum sp.]|nr:hypothetical protein [Cellulosilyticum sp.]
MRLIYGLSTAQLEAINQGINALLVIKDGNYQLPQYQQPTSVTKDEIIATLRVLANVIEKGAT